MIAKSSNRPASIFQLLYSVPLRLGHIGPSKPVRNTCFILIFFILTSIFILSGNSSVDSGLPIVSVPGGCFLGSRCPLPFCHQYHHLHIHPSSFTEVIWSLLSSSSFKCPSSCFHCSFCVALPEQTSSTSTKVCTTLSHICHRGLNIASLSVRWPPP